MKRRQSPITSAAGTANISRALIAQGHVYAEPLPPVEDETVECWSLPDIRAAAKIAVSRVRSTMLREDALDTAWEGIALAVADDPHVSWRDAVAAGAAHLSAEMQDLLRNKGLAYNRDQKTAGHPSSVTYYHRPTFLCYWTRLDQQPICVPGESDERRAVEQVMAALSDEQQATLLCRAASPSLRVAADRAGVSLTTYARRLNEARAAFAALWFEQETPPPPPLGEQPTRRDSDTCRHGHPWTEHESWRNSRGRRVRYCLACAARHNAQRKRSA